MPSREPEFPNPPLKQIDPKDLVTAAQAADQFGITPAAIRLWVHRGKIAPVLPGDRRVPALYYFPALSEAEKDAYRGGADRPYRQGRHPAWKPGTKVPATAARAA